MSQATEAMQIDFTNAEDGSLIVRLGGGRRAGDAATPQLYPLCSLTQARALLAARWALRVSMYVAVVLALAGGVATALRFETDTRAAVAVGAACFPLAMRLGCRNLWREAVLCWTLYAVRPLPPRCLPRGLRTPGERFGYGVTASSIMLRSFACSVIALFSGLLFLRIAAEAVAITGWDAVAVLQCASGWWLLAASLLTCLCCPCGILVSCRDAPLPWLLAPEAIMWVALFNRVAGGT